MIKLIKLSLIAILIFPAIVYPQSDYSELLLKSNSSSHPENQQTESLRVPLSLSLINVPAQVDPLKTKPNYGRLATMGGIYLAVGVGVHLYQNSSWWKGRRSSFRIENDWSYALNIDKLGHFYATQFLGHLFSSGLEAGDIESEPAAIYGAAAALAFELYVEIEDGFGIDYGFSPGDAGSDILGASYYLAQYYFPVLKNFQFRYSYYPSKKLRDGEHKGVIDDYEGEKYWLSMRVKNLLPESLSKHWPSFLNISAGMGVENLNGIGGGQREFYIGLDLDAEALPLYGKGWEFVKNTLNYFHFPMPGIRITPNAAFFVFLF
jgi:Predicted periplasmic lipoprotein (DUF2279)